jgi:NitT/TauT family transport system ATP-binding protein
MTRDEMNDALLDIWERYRKTGLFVTHAIREAVYLADRVLVMTKRPATLVADIRIPFDRPRDPSINNRAEFNDTCDQLRRLIEHKRTPWSEPKAA